MGIKIGIGPDSWEVWFPDQPAQVPCKRFLTAHSPTARAAEQTYNIAVLLQRGDALYSEL